MFILLSSNAQAISLIRDAETEDLLRDFSNPIFEAAKIDGSTVRIFIVNDPAINAFVAGGANLFIHTGLILAAETPEVLLGVIAHETGHIAGGHLARGAEALENAQLSTILTFVLGAAAGLAGGGDAAVGTLAAGQHLTQRQMLSFTRINEQAADQAALSYLDSLGISAEGLLTLMEKLRANEQLYRQQLDPYAVTHPLSKDRITHIRGHIMQQTTPSKSISKKDNERYQRVLAKLQGFISDPETVINRFKTNSAPHRLGRAVAYHRISHPTKALAELDELLEQEPQNPYFLELKGQILIENGQAEDALKYYARTRELKPNNGLLRTDYARALLAQSNPDYEKVIDELTIANRYDSSNSFTWQLLGQTHAKLNHQGDSALAYAEAALLRNEADLAQRYAAEALKNLQAGSPALLRAQDLREEAIRLQKEKRKNS